MVRAMTTERLDTKIRKEQIVRAALNIIATHGLGGLSIGSLARRVGLVPSAIYRHFKNKDEVIDSTLDYIQVALIDIVTASSKDTADTVECLRRVLMRHIRLIRENVAIPRIVFSEEVYSGSPERKAKLYLIIQGYLDRISEIVRCGQGDGQIRSDILPGTVAIMFLGLIQPAAMLWHISDGGFDVTKHAEKAWDVFRKAILAQ